MKLISSCDTFTLILTLTHTLVLKLAFTLTPYPSHLFKQHRTVHCYFFPLAGVSLIFEIAV